MSKPMKVESVPIDSVYQDPANVNRHDERNLRAIRSSLARFGQQRPILVDRKGIIRAGNGTYEAARHLEWTHINVVRTDLEGSEATAYAIADNRTARLSVFDDVALADTLRALQAEGFDTEAAGFTGDELDALVAGLGGGFGGEPVDDPAAEWEGMPEFEHEDLTPHRTLQVHFKDEDGARDFARLVGQPITDKTRFLWHPRQEIIRYGDAE